MRRSIAIAAGLALSLGTASLAAAEGEKETLSGQVTEKQGDTLTIRSATGGDVDVQTTGDTQVRGPQGTLDVDDIDEGDNVRVTSMSSQAGQRIATEIEVVSSAGAAPGADVPEEDPSYREDPRQLLPDENPERGMPDELP